MHLHCEHLGESALLLRLGDAVDAAVNTRVHALAAALRRADLGGVDDVIPTYASVLLCHHLVEAHAIASLYQRVRALAADLPEDAAPPNGRLRDIPVCYGDACGEDLVAVAQARKLAPEQVIALHAAPEYRVAMTGFAPGFPYLIGMDARIATPRRATPRTCVPAGSVGIAGAQTGIYPGELPGGWQLIGRTPLSLFDAGDADHPCLLEPGDRVRFHAIDIDRFRELQTSC